MSANFGQIGDLLFGKTRGRVLALLFGRPDRSFYLRQIARELATSAGSVQRELEALAQVGLLERTDSGHQVYYQVNAAHPVYAEMEALVAKTVGLNRDRARSHAALAAALAKLRGLISFAFLYRSTAPCDESEGISKDDLHLMIVGDVAMEQIDPLVEPIERQMGRSLHAAIVSAQRFRDRLDEGSPFFQSLVEGEKIVLLGEVPKAGSSR